MDKRIGKTFLIFLLLTCSIGSVYAGVTLRITDTQGHELEQVAAGQPFMVEVVIADIGSQASAPSFKGDSRITLQSRGQQFTSINGKSNAKYSYLGQINEPGVYVLGPATVMQAGQPNDSNVMHITVGTTQKTVGKQHKQENEEVLFELSLDKKHLFVGESALVTLTFYYMDDTVALKNIIQPTFDGFTVSGDVNKYTEGREKIKGSVYSYVRWEWQLYPNKTGALTIPAYGAEYEKLASNNHRFGLELFFAGRLNERLRTYSNAQSIQVDPLPPYNGLVTAVGLFKQVTATIEPSVAQEGEAVVLAIEFEGEGDLDAIKTPELRGMPEALKYYDSKHYIVPSEDKKQFSKKRFEYIVQGLRAGTWQIPMQEFVIFDVKKKAYKKFNTKPLAITITPNAAVQKSTSTQSSSQNNNTGDSTKNIIPDDLLPIDETGLWYRASQRAPLSLWLFVLLSLLPGIYLLVAMVWRMIKKRVSLHEPAMREKKAFIVARDALEKAQQNNEVTHIYPILIQLIADRCRIDSKKVTQDFIEKKLQEAGLSNIECTKWHDFFMQVIESAYGKKTTDTNNLFAQAKRWVDTLEGVL